MEKTYKEKDHYGKYIIYVQKCKNYKYENPDNPKKPILELWV